MKIAASGVRRLAGKGEISWEPSPELGSGIYMPKIEQDGKLFTKGAKAQLSTEG